MSFSGARGPMYLELKKAETVTKALPRILL
jgi:hypothetical protein